jgi:hypothetical protein
MAPVAGDLRRPPFWHFDAVRGPSAPSVGGLFHSSDRTLITFATITTVRTFERMAAKRRDISAGVKYLNELIEGQGAR